MTTLSSDFLINMHAKQWHEETRQIARNRKSELGDVYLSIQRAPNAPRPYGKKYVIGGTAGD